MNAVLHGQHSTFVLSDLIFAKVQLFVLISTEVQLLLTTFEVCYVKTTRLLWP